MASSFSSLAPAPIQQCTVYVSNLPFSLTNNDLHQIFQQFGPISKITIVKDRQTRKSKGVAFIVFEEETSTSKCIDEINQKQMFGRQLKASIAKDNGRSDEFAGQQRKKPTTDPNNPRRCFECGEEGHLSYECPKNSLGVRPLPAGKKFNDPKNGRKKKYDSSGDEDDEADSLSAAIRYEQSRRCGEMPTQSISEAEVTKKKKFKQSSYFSDEEELSD